MHLLINGQEREFPQWTAESGPPAGLQTLIDSMGLKGDRIAVEHNGAIIVRAEWPHTILADGDKLEIVHFVGGGISLAENEQPEEKDPE